MQEERWQLPARIEEILPPQAEAMERLRRDLLDLYKSWGYELVIPPFVAYFDSLLTGTGRDLDLQTFKLTDQLSGRMLGARADMTPQVALIDAHHLRSDAPTRLCYLGTVLHTRSDGFAGTRSPMQIGAEIYGHAGAESDAEILRLALLTLERAGIANLYLDLGHVGIYRGLARQAGLDDRLEMALFEALQRRAVPEIEALIDQQRLADTSARMLLSLAELNGEDALDRAVTELAGADKSVQVALSHLQKVADETRRWLPEVPIHFDLAELRGYYYKTGVVFAAFIAGWGQEIARGGRYDDTGRVFGRSRPAVGFSTDLKGLLRLGTAFEECYEPTDKVFAPWSSDPALQREIARLRREGRRVVTELPGQDGGARELGCSERLERRETRWVLAPVQNP
jgi:ATP phosphoribosyltransferase regulatory subunit